MTAMQMAGKRNIRIGLSKSYLLLAPAITAIIYLVFAHFQLFRQTEANTLDLLFRLRPPIYMAPQLGTIDIDSRAIERAGSWPISRKFYADFARVLHRYDARLMLMDIFFPDPRPLSISPSRIEKTLELIESNTEPEIIRQHVSSLITSEDAEFSRAMKETRLTVLAQNLLTIDERMFEDKQELARLAKENAEALTPEHKKSVQIAEKYSVPFDIEAIDYHGVAMAVAIEPPDPVLLDSSLGVGFAQTIQDGDGVVRKYPMCIYYNGRLYPSLLLMGMSIITETPLEDIKLIPNKHLLIPGAHITDKNGDPATRDIRIPVDKYARMMINWAGDYLDTFTHLPATALLYFRGVDLIREKIRDYNDNTAALIEEGFGTISAEIADRKLLDESEADWIIMRLIFASLAESAWQTGKTRGEFIDSVAGEEDIETRSVLSGIWDETVNNNRILGLLAEKPDIDFETIAHKLDLPLKDRHLRYSTDLMRFLVKRGKNPDLWRPLYFMKPLEISFVGSERKSFLSPIDLAGKILFVGLTATGTHDFNPMPFSPRYPMVGLYVNAANTILTDSFIRILPNWMHLTIIFCGVLIMVFTTPRLHPFIGALCMLLVVECYLLAARAVFNRTGIYMPVVSTSMGVIITYLSTVIYRYFFEQQEKQKIRNIFSTYMTPAVVDQVLKNPAMLKLGGQKRDITVYFSDIEGFTTISESNSPEELVAILNEYLDSMTNTILKYNGTLDKYEGDAIMAFWNAPLDQKEHALLCCYAALDCMKNLETVLQPKWQSEGKPILKARIGINTGAMIVGNMGSTMRMDYTVIGDAVNLGARLESANKEYGSRIMISETTLEHVKENIVYRNLDALRVKGKARAVNVYEIMARKKELTDEMAALLDAYNQGLEHYRNRRWPAGIECFTEAMKIRPGDGPSATYIKRCEVYLKDPPPENWDGVWTLHSK